MTDAKVQTAVRAVEKGKAVLDTAAPIPHPTDEQVLIKVGAASINPIDWKILNWNPFGFSFPFALGLDVSGTIATVGKNVKDFKVGDEVFTTLGFQGGAFAEYAVALPYGLAHKGSKLTHVQAAALPVAYLSALDAFAQIKVEAKQTIFIPGGAGGVGHYAVQLAKIHGLTVIASGGADASLALLKELKADHILNYKTENVVEAVLKLTDGKGVDWVYDATYLPDSILQSTKVIKEGGTVVVLGNTNLPKEGTDGGKVLAERKARFAEADLGRYSRADTSAKDKKEHIADGLTEAVKYFEAGQIKPHIVQVIGLDGVIAALDAGAKGKTVAGKIVIDLSPKK